MAKYRGKNYYMGAWRYVFLDILYAIPILGFIMLLVHSFSNKNENRLHYARSYFARFLLALIIVVIMAVLCYFFVGTERLTEIYTEVTTQIQDSVELVEPIIPATEQTQVNDFFPFLNYNPTDAPVTP